MLKKKRPVAQIIQAQEAINNVANWRDVVLAAGTRCGCVKGREVHATKLVDEVDTRECVE